MSLFFPVAMMQNRSSTRSNGSLGDLIINNGQSVTLNPNTVYHYDNVNIKSGGILYIGGGAGFLTLFCKHHFILDGTISGEVATGSGSNWTAASLKGNRDYDHVKAQKNGGTRGKFSLSGSDSGFPDSSLWFDVAPTLGHGGFCSRNTVNDSLFSGVNIVTESVTGGAFNAGGAAPLQLGAYGHSIYATSNGFNYYRNDTYGADGFARSLSVGTPGHKGYHGGGLIIHAVTIKGSGSISLRGQNGGGCKRDFPYLNADINNKAGLWSTTRWYTPTNGGGAGGNGGKVYLEHMRNSGNSFFIQTGAGLGGIPTSDNTYSINKGQNGEDGITGEQVARRII